MNNSNNHITTTTPPNQPSVAGMAALEHYRLTQLYQYAMAAERIRNGHPPGGPGGPAGTAATFFPPIPSGLRSELGPLLYGSYCRIDPRLALCRPPDEPKPQHSYIGLIAMAILGSPDKKLVLSDIYQYILDNYAYFRTRGPGWRNSIRHNLSLNDCFVKSGRSANGKGHYWAVHPANVDDFTKGDFRRRKAQRKVRKHMGLAVDDPDSPSPPPLSPPPVTWSDHQILHQRHHLTPPHFPGMPHPFGIPGGHCLSQNAFELNSLIAARNSYRGPEILVNSNHLTVNLNLNPTTRQERKRFDVASLLAPEQEILNRAPSGPAMSPASTSKSIKSEDDCDMLEPSSSRTPSPVSPICKAFKKLSPQSSEEDVDVSDDDDKDPGHQPNTPSSDQEDHSKCNHRLSKVESRDSEGMSKVTQASQLPSQSIPDPVLHHHLSHGVPLVPPGFTMYPHHLLQHNPSLASLMLLSSRYRELTTDKYSREIPPKKSL